MAESASFIEAMKSTTRTPPPQYAEIIDANLGKTEINPERAIEWELGKNQCAAGGGPTVRTQEASVR
jgi:hypothetical protein